MENSKVAKIAFLGQAIRLLSGPLVLLVISKELSTAEMALYYTFFSILAIQQVLEMGIGFTIKQFIAHAYKVDTKGVWLKVSKEEIKNYYSFSSKWYLVISLFVFVGIGSFGLVFFQSGTVSIDWESPWLLMIVVIALFINLIPLEFVVEGCQQQHVLYSAKLLSSVIGSISLIISMSLGFGLYSIGISRFFASVTQYVYIYFKSKELIKELLFFKCNTVYKDVFTKVWPMLSKISVTWILGYFFWNSFNLIAFKTLPIDDAGKLAFTLSLAMAGYNIVSTIINSQTTFFSKEISDGRVEDAVFKFRKFNLISLLIICLGYMSFLIIFNLWPGIYIFDKVLSLELIVYIFIYFVLVTFVTNQGNFSRCFKREPYFYLSLFSNITVPVLFLLVCMKSGEPNFLYLIPNSIICIVWSHFIFKKNILLKN